MTNLSFRVDDDESDEVHRWADQPRLPNRITPVAAGPPPAARLVDPALVRPDSLGVPRSGRVPHPADVTLDRWDGGDEQDSALIRTAADGGYQGLLLYGRDSLKQPDLRCLASEKGVVLVAVEGAYPIEAMRASPMSWRVLASSWAIQPSATCSSELGSRIRSRRESSVPPLQQPQTP